ncbi:hypothetical protein GGF46_005171 [Coemansia sp. RSA 552]|nr:hypothetical protein GGF46_005171 [Coemansia sp. RSA 552]
MFRPRAPFFRQATHRAHVLSEYRRLIRRAEQFDDPVERTYLRSWIRERFHFNKRQTSPAQVQSQLSDGVWAYLVMSDALEQRNDQHRVVSDLAFGRQGYLKDIAQQVREFCHPTNPCHLLYDVRPRASRIQQPHRAYWIPLDPRAFSIPEHLVERLRQQHERDSRRERERRRRRDVRLRREIAAMTDAVRRGNPYLRDSGLLKGAFTQEALRSPDQIPGIAGNPGWIPPKIRNRLDPPFVQHVRASAGVEFYRVNGRKPPHWLACKIAALYRRSTRHVQLHEFYFGMVEDLRLEEEFEQRLGIEDGGYWIYARNYREYLRGKVKENTQAPDIVLDKHLDDEIWAGQADYEQMLAKWSGYQGGA